MAARTADLPVCLLVSLLAVKIASQLTCGMSRLNGNTQVSNLANLQAIKPEIFNVCHHASMIVCHLGGRPSCSLANNLARQLAGHTACLSSGFPASPSVCLQAFLPSGQPVAHIACHQAGTCCMVQPMIIVVANSKGGVGKSTLAVHLAVWLH
jgi:hypothetical protein